MASYTMELRTIIEQATQDIDTLTVNERIQQGRKNLFDFNYPMFDEDYRHVFETNFIRNFYTREIGFETEQLFKFRLETWLNINMPYYNKLFKSELIEFDPLESYSLKTTYQKKNDLRETGSNNTSVNETGETTTNESSSVTQNIVNAQSQSDTREIDGTLQSTTATQDDGTSRTTLGSTLEGERDVENNTTSDVESFNRKLTSDTPDSRLQITTNEDGTGVIEYASQIEEDKNKSKTVSKSNDKEKTKNTESSKTDVETSNTGESETNESSNSSESFNSSIDGSQNVTGNDTRQSNGSNSKNSTLVGSETKSINDIEDYIETKVGSIGVKTYSEMIEEYRSILLRIEKTIFEEMNELFMLVY